MAIKRLCRRCAVVLALLVAICSIPATGMCEKLVSEWTGNTINRVDDNHFRDMVTMEVIHQLDKNTLVNMKRNIYYVRTEPDEFVDQRSGEPYRVEP